MLLYVLIYIVIWALAWGLWWDRILSKAGFSGGRFRLLFILLNLPVLLLPLSEWVNSYSLTEILYAISAISLWLGIVLTALLPWPVRQQAKKATAARKPSP